MTDNPITWNAGDFHHWERPASEPCPNCVCCSAALCKLAIEKDTACHFEGSSADYNLADCPCWRKANAARLLAEHGERLPDSYVDPKSLSRTVGDGE
ncbi:hypothetical protein ACGFIW_01170 [Micromonospora sp. NPDC048935]|uniref:hypothetical protein n=1 Tax=Micromonospora sp. NPDC048935 TaxID=3364262 RepID=UPI0037178E44